MAEFGQAVWGGLLVGSVYGLMALGLTLIWGALRLLNLAHGALFIVGAYAALAVVTLLNVTIFGGLGSVRGTIVAAYIIGTLGSFLQVYLGASWALPGVFVFIILVL